MDQDQERVDLEDMQDHALDVILVLDIAKNALELLPVIRKESHVPDVMLEKD